MGSIFLVDLWRFANQPASLDADGIVVNVEPGQTFKTTTEILHKKGIINYPVKFNFIARFTGYDKQLKAGEYLLSGSMSPIEILEKLVKGEIILRKLTIPEGYNIDQIADLIAEAGLSGKADFIKAANDEAFAREKGIDGQTFEGYLFPDTYFFPKNVTVEQILTVMVNRFFSVFTPEWKSRAVKLGFTVHQIVTLASIVEKETGAPFERPIISSVFHNRLKRKMRLESDPTVIYGIRSFDGNLTRKHLATPSPFNTYKISGLPPGPIANPGRESLRAALYPQDTEFIYFVSKKDNTHHFSTNLKDHNLAVRKYQLTRKR